MKVTRKKKQQKIKRGNKKIKGAVPKKPKIVFTQSFLMWRYLLALAIIIFLLVALAARTIYVQSIAANKFNQKADKISLRIKKLEAPRGDILDRNGKLLAVSIPMETVILNPKRILNSQNKNKENTLVVDKEKWQLLAEALKIPYSQMVQRIKKEPNSQFLVISQETSKTISDYIRKLKLPGISFEEKFKRFYPEGEETAHLLGYLNKFTGEGIEGIEKSFNSFLKGKSGLRSYRKDLSGKVIDDISDIKKYDAQSLRLSIDKNIQSMAFEEIKKAVAVNKAISGSAVLLDIRTGEILAMVNAPSYNPNNRKNLDLTNLRNRVIKDNLDPGSTIKPFVVLTALQHKVVKRNEIINTRPFRANGHLIDDVAPRNEQSLDDILKNSSNVGVSRLALRMPPEALMETYSKIGLGKSTDLGLDENKGELPINRKKWADIDRASVSYGYGFSTTPLQLARAYMTLGSFGIYRPLSITKVDPPILGKRVLPEKLSKEVISILEQVAEKNKKAMVEGYRVAVKTGTVRKLYKGKYVKRYIAYTAGIAPITDPRYALVVLINEPRANKYYGGSVSAPIFSRIMGYALRATNVQPDGEDQQKNAKKTVYLHSK